LVADRGNNRIQVLDLNGRFISEMMQFSRPSGIALLGDTLYVADSESNGVAPHPGWTRGIRIGSYSTGAGPLSDSRPGRSEGHEQRRGHRGRCRRQHLRRRGRAGAGVALFEGRRKAVDPGHR
jgi:hypothetical protein